MIEGSQDSLGWAWDCAFTQFITPAPIANKADIAVIMPKPKPWLTLLTGISTACAIPWNNVKPNKLIAIISEKLFWLACAILVRCAKTATAVNTTDSKIAPSMIHEPIATWNSCTKAKPNSKLVTNKPKPSFCDGQTPCPCQLQAPRDQDLR